MKKHLKLMLALTLLLGITGCSNNNTINIEGLTQAHVFQEKESELFLTFDTFQALENLKPITEESLGKYSELVNSIQVKADKQSGLQNGDSINVTTEYDKELAKELKVRMKNVKFKMKLYNYDTASLKDNIVLREEGISPNISIFVEYLGDDKSDLNANIEIIDKKEDIKEGLGAYETGDKVKIRVSPKEKNGPIKEEEFELQIKTTLTYPKEITQAQFENVEKSVKEKFQKQLDKVIEDGEETYDGVSYKSIESKYTVSDYKKAYFIKDENDNYSNVISIVYEVELTGEILENEDESKESDLKPGDTLKESKYVLVQFGNIILEDNEIITESLVLDTTDYKELKDIPNKSADYNYIITPKVTEFK